MFDGIKAIQEVVEELTKISVTKETNKQLSTASAVIGEELNYLIEMYSKYGNETALKGLKYHYKKLSAFFDAVEREEKNDD